MGRVRASVEANIPGAELPDVTAAQVKSEERDRECPQRGASRKDWVSRGRLRFRVAGRQEREFYARQSNISGVDEEGGYERGN
jgi:hypothetical protein